MRWIFNSQLQYTFTQHCHQVLQARNFLWSPSLFLDIDFRKLNMQTSHIMEMNIAFVGLFQNQNQLCFPLPNFYSDFITLIQDYKKAPTNNKTWTRDYELSGCYWDTPVKEIWNYLQWIFDLPNDNGRKLRHVTVTGDWMRVMNHRARRGWQLECWGRE